MNGWWMLPAAAGAFWMVAPARRTHPDGDAFRGRPIAHRGLHNGDRPENSLAAFAAAADQGFGIELDLRLTADGQAAVFHDAGLARLCGVPGKPETMTLQALQALRLAGTDQHIPSLAEVLALIQGRVPLLLEYKPFRGRSARLCAAAEALLRDYKGVYRIQSFSPAVLLWYRRHRPDIARGQLTGGQARWPGLLLCNSIGRPDFISCDRRHPRPLGWRLCRRLGAELAWWTVTSAADWPRVRGEALCIFENFLPTPGATDRQDTNS